ncbi:uncharacterized protein [Emydura macquarii macquarii]|uniref:uncharacterized protein isoform X1 n=1 Tax=Emydura macquarii macquarii TaxID=1129001 RepID=UPI00352B7CD3
MDSTKIRTSMIKSPPATVPMAQYGMQQPGSTRHQTGERQSWATAGSGTGTGPRIPSTVAAGPPPEGTSPLCASSRPSSPATGASQDGVNPSCPGVVRTAAWGRNDGSKSGQRHRQRAPRRRPALS